jgi:predicted RND superfamily exporter protein
VRVDSSFRRQFSPAAEVREHDRELNRAFGGTSTLVLLIEGRADGAIDEPRLLTGIDRLQEWLRHQPAVGGTLSYVDFVKRMHAVMADAGAGALPDSRELVAQYLLLYSLSGSIEDFDGFVDSAHRVCVLRAFLKEDSTAFATALIDRLRPRIERLIPPEYRVRITGSLASSDAMNEVMVRGKVKNIVQITAIILGVSSLVLRSAVGGLLVALPLALAVLTNFGLMGVLGIPLDIGTSTISAMAVGIGADYAIYFLYRLREELTGGAPLADATERTLQTSGKAILFVSSAIAAGYLTLCFSGFGYHVRLGALVAFAMVVSSVASLTVLPALVLTWKPRFLLASRPSVGVLTTADEPR